MLFQNKTESPAWTPEAKLLLKKVPQFILPLVRKTAEREANKRHMPSITAELLQELAERYSPRKREKFRLEDCYAMETDNPLYGSFPESFLSNGHGEKIQNALSENQQNEAWLHAVSQIDAKEEKALYIHIPFCATRCKYCGFFVNGSNPEILNRYTKYLIRELRMLADTEGIGNRTFGSVYFGGGTPSDLSAENLEQILSAVRNFNLSPDCEITLEGRISSLSENKIALCRHFGVNRYSLGIQSFNTALRRTMGRISTRETVIEKLQYLRNNADAAIVIDQIYGLPGQTMQLWQEDLDTLFHDCPVDGVDHYPLIRMPETPLDREVKSGVLPEPPSAALRADMFITALNAMQRRNVRRVSLKHFAFSPLERNRYNRLQAYGGCCIPAGCGGGGCAGGYFFYQGGTLEDYFAMLAQAMKPVTLVSRITHDDALFNYISGELLTRCELSLSLLQQHFSPIIDLADCFRPLIKQYAERGLLSMQSDEMIRLTPAGQFWNNAIFQHLKQLYLQTTRRIQK